MSMWGALQYVGTGLSLVAFVVAAIFLAYRARLTQRAEIIRSAPEQQRLEAIATTAEFFRVDVSGLTRAQQQEARRRVWVVPATIAMTLKDI
jgi:hypothetical protein